MALEYTFTCPLPNGMHARPASHLAELAAKYKSRIVLQNQRTGAQADAASVLELVAAGVTFGDGCRLRVEGPDEPAAYATITGFIENVLPGCDAPLPPVAAQREATVPRVLREEQLTWLKGVPASPGIGFGRVFKAGGLTLPDALLGVKPEGAQLEKEKLATALAAVAAELQLAQERATGETEAEILRADLALIKDASFAMLLHELVRCGRSAGQAVVEAVRQFTAKLAGAGSIYLRERAADLEDLGVQLLERIYPGVFIRPELVLRGPSVVIAPSLAPRQLLALDRSQLAALVLSDAGATSHVVILARSFGIPAVAGVQDAAELTPGQEIVVDAIRGLIVFPPSEAVRHFYKLELEREKSRQARLADYLYAPARTRDGRSLEVAANIGTDVEAAAALECGAEGIGLFRTEMLFSEHDSPPTEEEQFTVYRRALEAMQGRPVIIRTFDIGGDKPIPYMNLPREENPFLGKRGIRLYEDHAALFTTQLRAILRASALGTVKLMAPMVATVDEARFLRRRVEQVQAELGAEGIAYDPRMPVGIMLEVPAAALAASKLSAVVDFFSIGTNDLCQYFIAVDRGNKLVAGLYNEHEPSFLRLLKLAVDEARQQGRWIGMCGEMARRKENLPLLVGLGLDEISLSAPGIPDVKTALAGLDSVSCRALLEAALDCESAQDVSELLKDLRGGESAQPLFAPELAVFHSSSHSKAEAIKELADLCYSTLRTDDAERLEEAVWTREAVYSTGLGHGFAIPHCKTDAIDASTLAVLKLEQPIAWGSQGDEPVTMVLLLAIRESDPEGAHLRIFSRLARKLMNEDFRAALSTMANGSALLMFLTHELELSKGEE